MSAGDSSVVGQQCGAVANLQCARSAVWCYHQCLRTPPLRVLCLTLQGQVSRLIWNLLRCRTPQGAAAAAASAPPRPSARRLRAQVHGSSSAQGSMTHLSGGLLRVVAQLRWQEASKDEQLLDLGMAILQVRTAVRQSARLSVSRLVN